MKFLLWSFICLLSVRLTKGTGNYDHGCHMSQEDVWLDIVLVVDNSKLVEKYMLVMLWETIDAVFSPTRIGTNYADPRSTRVGIVTYNQDATVVADLNKFQSFNELSEMSHSIFQNSTNIEQSYMASGMLAAEKMLLAGRSNGYRNNYRQLIIVCTPTYQGTGDLDPLPIANRLKSNGIKIAALDMKTQEQDIELYNNLRKIVNEAYVADYLTSSTFLILVLLDVNCFCRDSWTQYHDSFFQPQGVCSKVFNQKTNWQTAKLACQNAAPNGYLVADFGSVKHDFLQSLFHNTTGNEAGYHIGLYFMNGQWYWQQPIGAPLVSLNDTDPDQYPMPWYPGYPKSASANTGVAMISDSDGNGWQNINPYNNNQNYICEVDACDPNNYCP